MDKKEEARLNEVQGKKLSFSCHLAFSSVKFIPLIREFANPDTVTVTVAAFLHVYNSASLVLHRGLEINGSLEVPTPST